MKTHYGTLELAAGETLRDYKIIANQEQHGVLVQAGLSPTLLDNVEVQGGEHGIVIRGSGMILAQRIRVSGAAQGGIVTHQSSSPRTRDVTISEFEVSDCGYGGVMAQGPIDSLTIRDGEVWNINRDGGTSADGITGYDAGNKNVHVVRCNVRDVHNHHGIHVSGENVQISNCSVRGVDDDRYSQFMVGHTIPGNQGNYAAITNCFGAGGSSYGVWAREFTHVNVNGGYYGGNVRGVYLEKCKHVTVDGGAVLHPSEYAAVHAHQCENVLVGSVVADSKKRLIRT